MNSKAALLMKHSTRRKLQQVWLHQPLYDLGTCHIHDMTQLALAAHNHQLIAPPTLGAVRVTPLTYVACNVSDTTSMCSD